MAAALLGGAVLRVHGSAVGMDAMGAGDLVHCGGRHGSAACQRAGDHDRKRDDQRRDAAPKLGRSMGRRGCHAERVSGCGPEHDASVFDRSGKRGLLARRGASPPIALSTTRRLRAMQEGRRSHGGERAVRMRSTRCPGPLQRPIDNRLPDTRPSLISRRAHFAGHDQGRGCQEQPYLSSASILSGILIAMHNKMHGTARTDLSEALHLKRSFAMRGRHLEDDERSC